MAVGSSASTVNVQSSWFCSKRRRKLVRWCRLSVTWSLQTKRRKGAPILLFGNAIAAHTLASIVEFIEDIIRHDISSADNSDADGDGGAIPAEPSSRGREHDFGSRGRDGPFRSRRGFGDESCRKASRCKAILELYDHR